MPRRPPLPERLRYLEPFRKVLNRLEPEEFNEDMDVSLLHQLVLKRTEGLGAQEAVEVLKADGSELKIFLSSSGYDDEPLHCLEAQLSVLPDLIEEIRNQPIETKAKLKVQMEFPKGVRERRMQQGVLRVTWPEIVLFAMPADEKSHRVTVDGFSEEKWMHPSYVTVDSVNFGPVTGQKRVRRDGEIVVCVDYALVVPGGYVSAGVMAKKGNIDTAEVEKCFHTMRLIPD